MTQNSVTQTENSLEKIASWSIPRSDVYESPKDFLLFVNLPGVEKDKLKLTYENEKLELLASRPLSGHEGCHQFKRSFQLDGIAAGDITAKLQDGVLSVTLPKQNPPEARQITVE